MNKFTFIPHPGAKDVKNTVSASTPTSKILTVYHFLAETLTDKLNFFKLVQYIEKSKIAHKVNIYQSFLVLILVAYLSQIHVLENHGMKGDT